MKKIITTILSLSIFLLIVVSTYAIHRYDNQEVLEVAQLEGWEITHGAENETYKDFESTEREGVTIILSSPSITLTNNFNIHQGKEKLLTSDKYDLREAPQENEYWYSVIIVKPELKTNWDTAELTGFVENMEDYDYMIENLQKFIDNSEWVKRPKLNLIDKVMVNLYDITRRRPNKIETN